MCQMFPLSVERKVGIEYDPLTSQRKTRTELIRSRKHHLAIVVNGTRWPVTHVTEKHRSGLAVFLKKLAFDYSKMKAVMGKVFRNRPTIKPTERT